MSRPRALDLYCGAGGASAGLMQAGFEVVGVDIVKRPSYPYKFLQANVLELSASFLKKFDYVRASPPCQKFCAYKRREGVAEGAVNLIPQTRELLIAAGVPYDIENVEGAREELHTPVCLCGSMFGLDVKRHRLFETNWKIEQLACKHEIWEGNSFPQATNRKNRRKTMEIGVYRIPLAEQRAAMGISWMNLAELSLAIPPSYTKWIGEQFLKEKK